MAADLRRNVMPRMKAHPLVALLLLGLVVAAVPGMWAVGNNVLGADGANFFTDRDSVLILVLGLAGVAVFVGASLGPMIPTADTVGSQLLVLPRERWKLVVDISIVPIGIGAAVFLPFSLSLLVPLTRDSPGGLFGLLTLLVGLLYLVVVAATLAVGVRQRRLSTGLLVVTIWIVIAVLARSLWSPMSLMVDALAGFPLGGLTLLLFGLASTTAVWLWNAGRRVTKGTADLRRSIAMPSSQPLMHFVVGSLVLLRRADLRSHFGMLFLLAIAAAVGALVLDPTWEELVVTGASSLIAVGSGVIILASFELDDRGSWLWGSTPSSPYARLAAHAWAGVVGAFLSLASCTAILVLAGSRDVPVAALFGGLGLLIGPNLLVAAFVPLKASGTQQMSVYAISLVAGLGFAYVVAVTLAQPWTSWVGVSDNLEIAIVGGGLSMLCVITAGLVRLHREIPA